MDCKKIYLQLKNPCSPLFSDKALLWLASTLAAGGCRVEAVSGSAVPRRGELLLTNCPAKRNVTPEPWNVLRLTSSTDRWNRLMLALGYFYGKSRLFHASAPGAGGQPARRLIGWLKKPFRGRHLAGRPGEIPGAAEAQPPIPAGRKVVFRVNVDWDPQGFSLLERWSAKFGLCPTLAIAGSEIQGNVKPVKAYLERTGANVASHSWSHYIVLSSLNRARQQQEIFGNQRFLEDLSGKAVTGFVAPYTKYDRHTFSLLEQAGYRWFIRSWLVHPLPLPGFKLIDLGINFFFQPGWEQAIFHRLALSDLVFQLHLRDLVTWEKELEHLLEELPAQGVRIVDCDTYYQETLGGGPI